MQLFFLRLHKLNRVVAATMTTVVLSGCRDALLYDGYAFYARREIGRRAAIGFFALNKF
jgi:hypothetical protein